MTISAITSKTVTFSSSHEERTVAHSKTSASASNISSAKSTTQGIETPPTRAQAPAPAPAPAPEQVDRAIDQVNEAFQQKGQNLRALIDRDEGTGVSVVKVMDKETDEVVSQFPSKEILAIAESIRQFQEGKGYLVNTNA
ncbi:MAG: flagellar protein FlaG [Gallionellaceae bacterium]